EQDILPMAGGRVASLFPDAIAVGNYANDHHYPGFNLPLQPKSMRWGGRWTGTPFTIPYRSLIPATTDGLLVCEKNISVSHIANGATRLQPVVMGIGQAAGMAAAMCVELNCQPRDLPVRELQNALLKSLPDAAILVPLFNLDISPKNPEWLNWQVYYLNNPQIYPLNGNYPGSSLNKCNNLKINQVLTRRSDCFTGIFRRINQQDYCFIITAPEAYSGQTWQIVTLRSHTQEQLQSALHEQQLTIWGNLNHAGHWLLAEDIDIS
ncbi:FAD-dependent oxidoreductase, partial [Nodularia sphaerocarpa]